MGLIKAAVGAGGGVLADTWLEFFNCDEMAADTLIIKGRKQTSSRGRSSNTKAEDNVISNGSKIAVNEGQCMIIVESGKIAEFCAEPGEYTYENSTEPSLFYGDLGEGIVNTFKQIGQRFKFGGDPGKDQRVYYINIKEIIGNKFGTTSPIPFRVVDKNVGLDIDLAIRTNGVYSFRITDPVRFYTNIAGNVAEKFTCADIEGQLRSEMLTALQPALARISAMGIRYSELPGHVTELTDALRGELSQAWGEARGLTLEKVALNSVNVSEEDAELIKEMQKAGALRDPGMAAGSLTAAQGDAMRAAAANENGALAGFMGFGMAQQAGGVSANQLFEMNAQRQASAAPMGAGSPQGAVGAAVAAGAAGSWACPSCQTSNTGKFCSNCGTKKPEAANWFCPECGTQNAGKFCSNCGTPRP